MISVIIPTYNRASLLREAITSVFKQSFSETELIIVDDGSTDHTRQMVADLSRSSLIPIRYLYQKNAGAAAARNVGVRTAGFETICFLDSDDQFLPDKLNVQYRNLADSDRRISHTREVWFRRGKLLNQKKKHQSPDGDIFAASLRMCVVGMSTVMIRREIFDEYGLFDESLPCCEDYDFWLRVATREDFLLVDKPLVHKNGGRSDQLSVRYRQGMDKYRIRSLEKLIKSGCLNPEHYAMTLSELKRKCRIYGNGCIKHGRRTEGIEVLEIPDQLSRA